MENYGACGAAAAQAWGGYLGRALSERELQLMRKRMRAFMKAARRKRLRKRVGLLRRGIDPKIALDLADTAPKWICVNVAFKIPNDAGRLRCYKCSYFKDEASGVECEARGKDPATRQGRRAGKKKKQQRQAAADTGADTPVETATSGHDSETTRSAPDAKNGPSMIVNVQPRRKRPRTA